MNGYPKGQWCESQETRVPPLGENRYSLIQKIVMMRIRKEAHSDVNLNVFAVFIRLGNIFFKYLLFMVWIMRKGRISRPEKHKIILRVAWRMGCVYEWAHHVDLGKRLGIAQSEIDSIGMDESDTWSHEMRTLMLSTDELVQKHTISDVLWKELARHFNDDQLVEYCMLVGHYIMVATTINTLGIHVEPQFDLRNR